MGTPRENASDPQMMLERKVNGRSLYHDSKVTSEETVSVTRLIGVPCPTSSRAGEFPDLKNDIRLVKTGNGSFQDTTIVAEPSR
jgi:hypothetical protein